MRLAFACPFYGPTYPSVGFGQRASTMNAASSGHVWEDDYSTNGMQHREACETMLRKVAEDERLDAVAWTEHDVVLPPHAFERMAEVMEQTGADIVTGILFRRSPPHSPIVTTLEKVDREKYESFKQHPSAKMRELATDWSYEEFNERNFITIQKVDPKGEPFEVTGSASMGCLLIRRSAAQALQGLPELFAAEKHLSIDSQFFRHAIQKRGLKVVCAPDVLCGHLGDPQIIGASDWRKAVDEIIEKCEALKCARDPDIPQYGVLTRLANKHGSDKGSMCHQFTDFYEGFLSPIRSSVRKVLEVGVWQGASLKMWRDYFPSATIFGLDTDDCRQLDEKRIRTFVGDQSDRKRLWGLFGSPPEGLPTADFDLIVDDGGHHMDQQQVSLGALFPHVRPGGYYILEDLHTSLMYPGWGIKDDRSNTTLAMIEGFIAHGEMRSCHMTFDEQEYLSEEIAECRIFKGRSPLSLTCVMRKRG